MLRQNSKQTHPKVVTRDDSKQIKIKKEKKTSAIRYSGFSRFRENPPTFAEWTRDGKKYEGFENALMGKVLDYDNSKKSRDPPRKTVFVFTTMIYSSTETHVFWYHFPGKRKKPNKLGN